MKNTKFRKRVLLSSVAMLIVAMLALGSATFAWFTTNPNSTASGITMKANSSVGLVVQSASEAAIDSNWWTHEAVFRAASKNAGGTAMVAATDVVPVNPASMNTSGNMFTIQAAADNNYAAASATVAAAATLGTDYFAEDLNLKITGTETATQVTLTGCNWTAGSGNLGNAVRVAILDGTTILASFASSANVETHYLESAAAYSTALSSGTRAFTQKAASGLSINCGTWTSKTLKVVVYLDGEDAAVYSQNIGSADLAQIFDSLTLSFHAGS